MVRVTANTGTYSSMQSTTRFSFCADGGTFSYYSEDLGNITSSVENASATSTVRQAAFNADNSLAEGVVQYQSSPGMTTIGLS